MNVHGYKDRYIMDHGLYFGQPLTSEQLSEVRTLFETTEARIFWTQFDVVMGVLIGVFIPDVTRPFALFLAPFVLLFGFYAWTNLAERIYL